MVPCIEKWIQRTFILDNIVFSENDAKNNIFCLNLQEILMSQHC